MQKVCKSKDGGLNDALKLARRVPGRERWGRRKCRARAQWELGDHGHGESATHSTQQPIARAAQAKIFAPAAPASF